MRAVEIQISSTFEMASSSFLPNSSSSFSSNASSQLSVVPLREQRATKKGADLHNLVQQYNLGDEAVLDTADGAKITHQKVKATINKYAVNDTGRVVRRWLKQPLQLRSCMVKDLIQKARWLGRFEDDWAAEWLLRKAIDQRVVDTQRKKSAKEKAGRTLANVTYQSSHGKISL